MAFVKPLQDRGVFRAVGSPLIASKLSFGPDKSGAEESRRPAARALIEQDLHVHGSLLERVRLRSENLDPRHDRRPRLALPAQGH